MAAEADATRKAALQVRFLGRGHTAGDLVIYLPKERLVMTGDFLTSALSNMSDSYPDEWVASLDALNPGERARPRQVDRSRNNP